MGRRVGLVGAGKRMTDIYAPILKKLSDVVDVVGFTTRTPTSAERFENVVGFKSYPSSKALAADIDFFIVCVNASATAEVVMSLLSLGKPILTETPFTNADVLSAAASLGVPIGCFEQWPFLPLEQFKKMLIREGVFSKPFLAMNDCRSFDYHAIAQLRSYIGNDVAPTSVQGQSVSIPMPAFKDNQGKICNEPEGWDLGLVKFENGAVIQHTFSYNCKRAPFRSLQSLRFFSQTGSVMTGKLNDKDDDYEMLDFRQLKGTETRRLDVVVERADNITSDITDYTSGLQWKNPFNGLNDNDTAIACHIKSMAMTGHPLYDANQSYMDHMIVSGIKEAAFRNAVIGFKRNG